MSVGALIAVQLKHADGCAIFHFHAFCLMFPTYLSVCSSGLAGKIKTKTFTILFDRDVLRHKVDTTLLSWGQL
jgi:Trk-type K+ transport system membrane component